MKSIVNHQIIDEEDILKTITDIVSSTLKMPVTEFMVPDRLTFARKQNHVTARQLSMYFARYYTNISLNKIGAYHCGRDHATVMYACKTINGYIETKDKIIFKHFIKIDIATKRWIRQLSQNNQKLLKKNFFNEDLPFNIKLSIIKEFIKKKVPLEDRERILMEKNNLYIHFKNSYNNEHKSKAVSGKLQNGNKRSLQQRSKRTADCYGYRTREAIAGC